MGRPVYLYIKEHAVSGMRYFGKTTKAKEDMLKYHSSGVYWKRHLKLHGANHVVTVWYCEFYDKSDCEEFALFFSEEANIVNSAKWANLKPENGSDGAVIGNTVSPETRRKMSHKLKGKKTGPQSLTTCIKKSIAMKGKNTGPQTIAHRLKNSLSKLGVKRKPRSPEHCANQSLSQKGKHRKTINCPHCSKKGGGGSMFRWHFDNCKNKDSIR